MFRICFTIHRKIEAMNKYLPSFETLAAVFRNCTIVIALLCMFLFGRPGAPDCLREVAYPIAKVLGISQNNWTMFGPETSTENQWPRRDEDLLSGWHGWRMVIPRLAKTKFVGTNDAFPSAIKNISKLFSRPLIAAWPASADYAVESDRRTHDHR